MYDLVEQLALDFAEITATIPSVSGCDGQEATTNGSPVALVAAVVARRSKTPLSPAAGCSGTARPGLS